MKPRVRNFILEVTYGGVARTFCTASDQDLLGLFPSGSSGAGVSPESDEQEYGESAKHYPHSTEQGSCRHDDEHDPKSDWDVALVLVQERAPSVHRISLDGADRVYAKVFCHDR